VTELLVVVVISALIGFRLSRALSIDYVGHPVRFWAERVRYRDPNSRWRTWLERLVQCPHCTGFWITAVVGLIVSAILLDVDWPVDLALCLAATGLQSLLASYAVGHEH